MIARTVIGDSPSIYNNGPGGVSYFFTKLMFRHSPIVITDLNDLRQYIPWIYVLFIISPDKPISEDDAHKVLGWVMNGGEVIIMDETNNTRSLLKLLGINKTVFVADIVRGTCRIDGRKVPVLFDVYQLFPNIRGTIPICWAGNNVVAIEKIIGKGEAIVIGDSSLVINYIVLDTRYGAPNTYFVKQLVGYKDILVYEGNRAYRMMYSLKGVMLINAVLATISNLPRIFFGHKGLLEIVALMILWIIITAFVSVCLFSLPRAPYPRLKKPVRLKPLLVNREVQRGLKDWGVKTSKKK